MCTESRIHDLLQQAEQARAHGAQEQAFTLYSEAADLGSADAMFAIGGMYVSEKFRMVKKSNLEQLLLQGGPIFPWSIMEQDAPDMESALEWFCRGAEAGHVRSMCMAGSMLCRGDGCKADVEKGVALLEKAEAAGMNQAKELLALFAPRRREEIPDHQYAAWLKAFEAAVEAEDEEQFALYRKLKNGSDAQLTRLGRLIITRNNLQHPGYQLYKTFTTDIGIPLVPACAKRGSWVTFIRIDLNAFTGEDTLIAFSSDIRAEYLVKASHRLRRVGTAEYCSPSFGWLREEKKAVVYRIDPETLLAEEKLANTVQKFRLIDEEYKPDNAAFLIENGEKEYSAEVAAITGDRVEVLTRYTIGGSDRVNKTFAPSLLSLHLD